MKKIFSILLSFAIVLGMGSVVQAQLINDGNTVPLSKIYTKTSKNAISPAEDFTFKIEKVGVTNSFYTELSQMPDWSDVELKFSESGKEETQNLKLTIPEFNRTGIYTYKITETNNNVAGVTYDDASRFIKVTVIDVDGQLVPKVSVRAPQHLDDNNLPKPIEDGTKTDLVFNNTYEAGELAVTKKVTGNLGDKEKLFDVTVKFTKSAELNMNSTITYTDFFADLDNGTKGEKKISIIPQDWENNSVEKTFKVKHDTTVTFTNIPKGVEWEVKEAPYSNDGYATSYETSSEDVGFARGLINKDEIDTVKIVNYKNADVDTGISLDSIPYILILSFAVVGIGALIFRKRENANF